MPTIFGTKVKKVLSRRSRNGKVNFLKISERRGRGGGRRRRRFSAIKLEEMLIRKSVILICAYIPIEGEKCR